MMIIRKICSLVILRIVCSTLFPWFCWAIDIEVSHHTPGQFPLLKIVVPLPGQDHWEKAGDPGSSFTVLNSTKDFDYRNFRFIIHGLNGYRPGAIGNSENPTVIEDLFLSTSVIDQDHYGSWSDCNLILEVPKYNIVAAASTDIALNNSSWKEGPEALIEHIRYQREDYGIPHPLRVLGNTQGYNEIAVLGKVIGPDNQLHEVRIVGIFIKWNLKPEMHNNCGTVITRNLKRFAIKQGLPIINFFPPLESGAGQFQIMNRESAQLLDDLNAKYNRYSQCLNVYYSTDSTICSHSGSVFRETLNRLRDKPGFEYVFNHHDDPFDPHPEEAAFPLTHAIVFSKKEVVTKLLSNEEIMQKVSLPDSFGRTALHYLAMTPPGSSRDLELWSDALLRNGANLWDRDRYGNTPMLLFAKKRRFELLKRELSGSSISSTVQQMVNDLDPSGNTLLHYAVRSSKAEVVDMLLSIGASLDLPDPKGLTPLMIAMAENDTSPQTIATLLKYATPEQLNFEGPDGFSVLTHAFLPRRPLWEAYGNESETFFIDRIKPLIVNGAKLTRLNDVDVLDSIIYNIERGKPQFQTLKLLLASKLFSCNSELLWHKVMATDIIDGLNVLFDSCNKNINDVDASDKNLLMQFFSSTHTPPLEWLPGKIISQLVNHGFNMNYRENRNGRDALMYLVLNAASFELNWKGAISFLVRQGAEINGTDLDGNTPLILAVQNNDVQLAKALIENGADIEKANHHGKTALAYATELQYTKLAQLLTELRQLIRTDFVAAVQYVQLDEIRRFITSDFDFNHKYDFGEFDKQIPIDYALIKCHLSVMELLIASGDKLPTSFLEARAERVYNMISNISAQCGGTKQLSRFLEILSSAGVKYIHLPDKYGKSVVDYARLKGNREILDAFAIGGEVLSSSSHSH